MRESPSSEVSLHGGLVKAADPHLDPHEETSGRKQWKHGCERVFQSQRKRSKTSGKRYFQNFSTLCNQQVGGSNPSTSSILPQHSILNMGEFPSGQRGQTVNLLSMTSVVRIHLSPPNSASKDAGFCFYPFRIKTSTGLGATGFVRGPVLVFFADGNLFAVFLLHTMRRTALSAGRSSLAPVRRGGALRRRRRGRGR